MSTGEIVFNGLGFLARKVNSLRLGLLLLLFPSLLRAQLEYTTNNGAITITGCSGQPSEINIPESTNGLPVTAIGDYAFSVCPTLASVTIPSGITSIGEGAFANCSLTNVTIPNTVTNVGNFAFQMSTLTKIAVDPQNSAYSSLGGVLFDKNQTMLFQYPGGLGGNYAVPTTVNSIGEGAFYESFGLTGVVIPHSLTTIGALAFVNCTNLVSATIGNGVTSIEGAAFSGCSSLTNVTLGSNLISIGDSAFFGCVGLTGITIPSNVGSIGQQAFNSCFNLYSVYFAGNAPAAGDLAFYSAPATVYYLPGTSGWASTYAGLPTEFWTLPYPLILNNTANFGLQNGQFGFTVSWATNASVVVESCTNLGNPLWLPLATNALTNGFFYFQDPRWTNYPTRKYRGRSL